MGVMGAGSIGCYVGGKLAATRAARVTFVGRERMRDELAALGLTVRDPDGERRIDPEEIAFDTSPEGLSECDVVACCVKSGGTAEAADQLAEVLARDAVVVSLQNGVRNADVLRERLPGRTVIAGIVGFNVVSQGRGVFHRGMDGPIALEASDEPRARAFVEALSSAGLAVEEHRDLAPDQWTKLLVNLNNAVSALSGAPTQQLLRVPGYRRVVAAVIEEGVAVLRAAGIRPAKLRGVPVAWMPRVLRAPGPIVRLVTRAQMRVDSQARSSMWEDLTKGRPTEVDHLNGEIVALARRNGLEAPINRRIVSLVHEAEAARAGSPGLSPEQLAAKVGA